MKGKGAFVLAVLILALIISVVVGKYNSVLGEILGMAMIQPFLVILFLIMFLVLYRGLRWIFSKGQKGKEIEKMTKDEKSNSSYGCSDIYLKKSILNADLIEYQIINKENIIFWCGRCNLDQGKLHSISLYSGRTENEMVFQVTKEIAGLEYLIKDSQSIIGNVKITDNGLKYNNVDNNPIYTAILENVTDDGLGVVVDWAISLDTLQAGSSKSNFNYFILKGEENETLGKYYVSLRNIDLASDTNNKFDRRIAVIFSILIDNGLMGNSIELL